MSENILQRLRLVHLSTPQGQPFGRGHLSFLPPSFAKEGVLIQNGNARLQEARDGVNRDLLQWLSSFHGNVLRRTSEGVLFVTLSGIVLSINEAAVKCLNVKSEEILSRRLWDLLPDECFGFSMREALQFGISHKLLYQRYLGKDLEIGTTFVYEGPKERHGLIVFLRDVSERGKWQQQNRLQELGGMTAQVAHEIRNPLGGIRGYASLLLRDLEGQKHLQEMAGAIIEGTRALEKLVTSVLQYARPVQLEIRSVEMGQFLRQVVRFIRVDPACPENVRWELHIPNDPLLVPVDGSALKSALLNLIFNGLQAMPLGGALTVSLLKIDSSVQVAISDTGLGMEEEQLQRLFSPFYTTKSSGNGLGLVEVQKVVQGHGGSIDVRSRLNKGTTFTITLPLKRGYD